MSVRYNRAQCLERLGAEIARGRAILMAGAGNGIVAKFLERAGIDLVGVYNTGYFRMQGHGSLAGMLPILDANGLVRRMLEQEVLPQIRSVPVIAGIAGVDPLRDMHRFLSELRDLGLSGVHNFPTVAWFDGAFRRALEATGLGLEHEIAMLRAARELELLTVAYAFNETDTERVMREADPDIFIFHAGITGGGSTGDAAPASLAETAARSEHHFKIARHINPEVIVLAHGAALQEPEDAAYLLRHTSAQGVQLGSAIERLAIEVPLEARARAFKAIHSA